MEQADVQGGPSARIAGLGQFSFWLFHHLPGSAWADGKVAELAEQLGKIAEPNPSQLSQQMAHPVLVYCNLSHTAFAL